MVPAGLCGAYVGLGLLLASFVENIYKWMRTLVTYIFYSYIYLKLLHVVVIYNNINKINI